MERKIFVIFLIALSTISCGDDEDAIKDEITVKINGLKSVTLTVHRPTAFDSFGDCTVAFIRTATNRIEDYRQVAIRIDDSDCNLKGEMLPYKADDFFLYYSNGVGGPDYHNNNNKSESELTITQFSENTKK